MMHRHEARPRAENAFDMTLYESRNGRIDCARSSGYSAEEELSAGGGDKKLRTNTIFLDERQNLWLI